MTARRAAAFVVVLCAMTVLSLALPWFRADLSARTVEFSGPEVAPVLWVLLPVVVAVALPVMWVARRSWLPDDVAWQFGRAALVFAIIALVVILAVIAWPGAQALPIGVADPPQVGLTRQPACFVAAGAMAGAAALLCAWLVAIHDARHA